MYVEKLAAADESEWKDNLDPMGNGTDIPRMFRTGAKVGHQLHAPARAACMPLSYQQKNDQLDGQG